MMTLRNFISPSLGLFLLAQCNTKQDSSSATQVLSSLTKTHSKNPFTGEWKYSNSIWYTSELMLNDNGTFKFHDQGCYGQRFSHGQWTISGGIVQLTSFDTFNQNEQTETNTPNVIIVQKKSRHKFEEGEVEYSFVDFKDAPPTVLPGPCNTIRVYLNKVQLQLKNDTLYCIGSRKLPEEAKFHRTKNNR